MKVNTKDLNVLLTKTSPAKLQKAKLIMANQMLIDTNKFVPMEFGELRDSGVVAGDGSHITWFAPYASFVHDMPESSDWTTAGTTSNWDEVASEQYQDQWGQVFMKAMDF